MKRKDIKKMYKLKKELEKLEIKREWDYLKTLEERAYIANILKNNLIGEDGNPYISTDWLLKNIMKFSDDEIEGMKK